MIIWIVGSYLLVRSAYQLYRHEQIREIKRNRMLWVTDILMVSTIILWFLFY